MHFTHYQKAGDKVFAVNPHDLSNVPLYFDEQVERQEMYRQQLKHDEFETWQSTQPPIYADPSIEDGVMYKVDELEIVWQRFAYGTWLDCYEELTEEQMFNSRLYARFKQPVKQEEKHFPETVKEVEEYEAKIGNPDINFPVEEMLIDLRYRMYKHKSEKAIGDLISCLKELWPLATNAFSELTVEEIKADSILNRLDLSIDNAKQLIEKYSNPLTP